MGTWLTAWLHAAGRRVEDAASAGGAAAAEAAGASSLARGPLLASHSPTPRQQATASGALSCHLG